MTYSRRIPDNAGAGTWVRVLCAEAVASKHRARGAHLVMRRMLNETCLPGLICVNELREV